MPNACSPHFCVRDCVEIAHTAGANMQKTPKSMTEHITVLRLEAVAESDALIFSHAEFTHLRACKECLRIWRESIYKIEEAERLRKEARRAAKQTA